MTPREIIYANLKHGNPRRPGMSFDGDRMNDFLVGSLSASPRYEKKRWTEGGVEYYDDEWGNVWRRMVAGSSGGEVFEPALKDWKHLESLRLPDFDDPGRYKEMQRAFSAPTDKFKLAGMPGWVFATSRYLRKMEVYFTDLIEYREEVNRLHELVTGLLEKVIRRCGEAGAEGIFYCEDLGVQDRTMISPAMWRDVFRPHYLRLTGAAHACGMKVFMHSCGYNWALLDDLAAAGVDCFQFDQPAAYDMAALADKFRALRVALFAPLDIQRVLPTGDRALIRGEAHRLVDTFRGFLILKNYGDLPGIGVKPEWDQWAYDEFLAASGMTAPARSA